MALGPRLDLRQSQQLVMTPQLQQAIKLLTLTNMELEGYLISEIEKNPLLESGEAEGPELPSEAPSSDFEPDHADNADNNDAFDGLAEAPEPRSADALMESDRGGETDSQLDIDLNEAVFHHDAVSDRVSAESARGDDESLGLNGRGTITSGGEGGDDLSSLENLLAENKSLHDHLHDQAGTIINNPGDLMIATHLIDMVDETGYLIGALDEVAVRLGVPFVEVERVLTTLQTCLEPTGVCARSLAECLKLQAREVDRLDPAMATLLDNLDLLARGDLAALRRLCRVDQDDLADMIQELRTYNPKPGLAFGFERTQTVVADIFVKRMPTGAWGVELNSATLPRVLINRSYYTELSAKAANREDKVFLSDCLQTANWLVKALDQRARTILKVATELVRQQEEFFEYGVRALKPLNLKNIAEVIGMHESTVSRVTTNKYLSCDRGLFELKYFFTSAISSSDGGDSVSAETVKQRIKQLIDQETVQDVLSDDKLVEILVAEKFDIARRTVAKYREALKIPSSVQRRRLKALEGNSKYTAVR